MERSHSLMEGIVAGIPRKQHRPVADGIVSGCKKDMNPKLMPDLHKVQGSATQSSEGVFGAGRTPQGMGDGRGAKAAPKKESVRHEAENNNQRDDEVDSGTKKGMMRKTARRAYM
jgi:hypothetical protein